MTVQQGRNLANFRLLEKVKAGFGAAGLVAVLVEGLFSPDVTARMLGLGLPISERLGGIGVVLLSLAAFFLALLFSDITEEEIEREFGGKAR